MLKKWNFVKKEEDNLIISKIFLIFNNKQKKTIMVSKKQEIFETMKSLFVKFEEEHNKTTKVSQKNARTHIGDLKKLVTDYRQASVEETKNGN